MRRERLKKESKKVGVSEPRRMKVKKWRFRVMQRMMMKTKSMGNDMLGSCMTPSCRLRRRYKSITSVDTCRIGVGATIVFAGVAVKWIT